MPSPVLGSVRGRPARGAPTATGRRFSSPDKGVGGGGAPAVSATGLQGGPNRGTRESRPQGAPWKEIESSGRLGKLHF